MGKQYLNGVLYGTGEIIKFSPYIYSFEEREVGVWTDGKPLYQKTWDFGSDVIFAVNLWRDTPIKVSDFSFEMIVCAYANDVNGTVFEYISVNHTSTYVQILQTRGADIRLRYLTLLYTKTTDTPGSGHYTTKGGEAHHYSTSEQIVGTWIDGKPLYEKTFQFANYVAIPTKSWTTIMNVSSLNISKLVRCDFLDMEGVYWSGALNRISNGNLQSYIFEGWPVKELVLQYTKTTD